MNLKDKINIGYVFPYKCKTWKAIKVDEFSITIQVLNGNGKQEIISIQDLIKFGWILDDDDLYHKQWKANEYGFKWVEENI